MKVRLYGKYGDLVYQLGAVREFAVANKLKIDIELMPGTFEHKRKRYEMTRDNLFWVSCLIKKQSSYIESVEVVEESLSGGPKHDLSRWFTFLKEHRINMVKAAAEDLSVRLTETTPWLSCDEAPDAGLQDVVAISRTGLYESDGPTKFWSQKVMDYSPSHFIGTPEECLRFNRDFGCSLECLYAKTSCKLLNIVRSVSLLIADQSFPLAIRHGLGKSVVAEVSSEYPDCVFDRENANYPDLGDDEKTAVSFKMRDL